MTVTSDERNTLRELAKKQCEIASLPVMKEREKLWYDINDGKTTHPVVLMEFHGIESEVFPELTCSDPLLRDIERQFTQNIYKHEFFKDDRVIPPFVKLTITDTFLPFGWEPEIIKAKNADNDDHLAFGYKHVIADLEDDFHMIKPSTFNVDTGLVQSNKIKGIIEDIVGDIMPVKLEFPSFFFTMPHPLCRMMGMENMFLALYDYPELFHKAMRQLTDDYHKYINALEAGYAILPNNDVSEVFWNSIGYTNDLPGSEDISGSVKVSDVWAYTNSQETIGMSASMYDEFFFSYMEEISERCGLLAYGCCEPVHGIWDLCLSRLSNLRKLSISPWCDEDAIAERIRGTKICYQRKPSSNFIGVADVFDEDAFLAHIGKSVKAARGCPLEVLFRDICSVRGEPNRLGRAVELTREAFQRWYQG